MTFGTLTIKMAPVNNAGTGFGHMWVALTGQMVAQFRLTSCLKVVGKI